MGFNLGNEAIADQSGSFSNWSFFELYLEFGFVATLFGAAGLLILHYGLRYKVTRIKSFLAMALLRDDWWFDKFATLFAAIVALVYIGVPVAGMVAWGLAAAIELDPSIVGVTVILLSLALASGWYGFGLWRASGWRLTYPSGIAVGVCVAMIMAFQLGVITATEPFSYIGFSAVFLSVNAVPMVIILYLNMPGTYIHFETFVDAVVKGAASDEAAPKKRCFGCCGPRLSQNQVRSFALYFVAQGMLCAYAILVLTLIDDSTVKYVGFANWGALLIIDIILFMYYYAGFFRSALRASLFFIAVRGIIIGFGARYWFIAHSVVFVLVALFLGISWVLDHYPARKSSGSAVVAHESLARVVLDNLPAPDFLSLDVPSDINSSDFGSSDLGGGMVRDASESSSGAGYDTEYEDDEYDADDDEYDADEYDAEYSEEQEEAKAKAPSTYSSDNTYETYDAEYSSSSYGYSAAPATGCCRSSRCQDMSWRNLILTRPFLMFMMSVAFVAEVVFVAKKEEATRDMKFLDKRREQYLFGIGSIVMSLVLPLAFLTYRLFQRAKFFMTPSVAAAAFATEFVVVGNGVFFYYTTDSIVVLGFHIFTPLIIIFAALTMVQWIRNDYFFLSSSDDREAAGDDALWFWLLPRDWLMIFGTLATLLMILGLSLVVALGLDAQITGWTIGLVIFVPLCTFISIKEWFNTFTFSWTNGVSVVLQIAALLGYALGVFTTTLDSKVDERSLALLFLVLVYPTLVLLVVGVWKWHDDKWQFRLRSQSGAFIAISLISSFLLMVGFGVVVMLVYKPFWAGLGVLVVVGIFYALVWVGISFVRNSYYLTRPYRLAVSVVLCGAVALGLGVAFTEAGFLGFCISWGSIFVMLVLVAVQDWFNARNTPRQFSKFIFPVYKLDVETGRLTSASKGVYCAYGALVVAALWGVAAALFFPPPWVGLLVTAAAVTFFILLTVHLLWDPPATFGAQLRFISADTLEAARSKAKGLELVDTVGEADRGSASSSSGGGDDEYDEYNDDDDDDDENDGEEYGSYDEEQEARYGTSSETYDESSPSSGYRYDAESATVTMDAAGRFLRADGSAASWREIVAERREFEANELGSRDSYLELLRYDAAIKAAFKSELRFVAHMQQLTLVLAQAERTKEEAIISAMIKETDEYNDPEYPLTASAIERWGDDEWAEFQERLTAYLAKLEMRRRRDDDRRKEDSEAQKKRDEARRKMQRELEKKRRKGKDDDEYSELGADVGLSFDPRTAPVIGSSPAKLIKKARRAGEPWSDDDFPADDSVLFKSKTKCAGWMRPEEIYEARNGDEPGDGEIEVFQADGIKPSDIRQGSLGDCWLLSAFAIVAQYPERVQEIFETDEPNEEGVYGVKLWAGGKWTRVIPLYAHTGDGDAAELWVMILEKAFAKMYGSYKALNGGLVHMGLVDMTGGQSEMVEFRKEENEADVRSGKVWKKMLKYRKAKYLMGCGSNAGKDTQTSKNNIVQGHAFAILDVVEVDGHRLIKLRNPWGKVEWTGDWSDKSPLWTRRLKAKLGWVDADDGEFWICYDDFVREFRNLYVCRLFPDSWHATGIASQWDAETAGGCVNYDTCKDNPQFLLKVSVPTEAFVTLAKDMLNNEVEHIAFSIYHTKDASSKIDPQYARSGDRVATSGKLSSLREVSCETKLAPGKYIIVPTTYKPGQLGRFVIAIHSNKALKLTEIEA
ncbi:calpain-B [Thecamonas trahens ATCC 50062]|uniref:Calpain-B n=1 Tax=Thecamonas trahens ATCC 50062 TaxID=461836 RepID=A0A0L0DHF8_THETB|nr:calpain-B [Thecamonas trahens ATCC 50062]KNC51799.1 calpain-B [Thecamonas trahens ATCC 50062]|eukprot:XP_013755667.1 calpain-B [Thecamonas trahens ATCC 50062]